MGNDQPDGFVHEGAWYPRVSAVINALRSQDWEQLVENVGTSHARELYARAGDLGTDVHEVIGRMLDGGVDPDEPIPNEIAVIAETAGQWIDRRVRDVVAVEERLTSTRWGFCGQMDLLAYLTDGSLAVIDWKTGAGGGAPQRLQTAAYWLLAKEHFERPDRRIIIHLGKSSQAGRISEEEHPETAHERDAKQFLYLLSVYRWIMEIESQ